MVIPKMAFSFSERVLCAEILRKQIENNEIEVHGRKRDFIAAQVGFSSTMLGRALYVYNNAPIEMIRKIDAGKMRVNDAYMTLKKKEKGEIKMAIRSTVRANTMVNLNDYRQVVDLTSKTAKAKTKANVVIPMPVVRKAAEIDDVYEVIPKEIRNSLKYKRTHNTYYYIDRLKSEKVNFDWVDYILQTKGSNGVHEYMRNFIKQYFSSAGMSTTMIGRVANVMCYELLGKFA